MGRAWTSREGIDLLRNDASDARLVADVVKVDPLALAELYDRHSTAAYSLARRMVGTGHADEVVQDAFLSLWNGAARYDERLGAVRPWLLGMVRNRSIDALRKLEVHDRRRSHLPWSDTRLQAPDSTEARFERAEEASKLAHALAILPVSQREVVELAYFGGLTQQEIAARLAVPLGTVKGRTRLALVKLKAELALSAAG